jgi:ABC-type transporter Mla subunit MlaD
MASEQEDDRAQQLEALRRYMVQLDRQWQPPAQLGIPPERAGGEVAEAGRPGRPSATWLVVAGLLVVLALVGGVVIGAVVWGGDRPAGETTEVTSAAPASRSPSAASGTPVATPACKTAVDRANAMLASAVKLRETLAIQDQFLDDPANRGLDVGEVLRRLAASREAGAAEGERFDRALDAYRAVVDQCDLRVP